MGDGKPAEGEGFGNTVYVSYRAGSRCHGAASESEPPRGDVWGKRRENGAGHVWTEFHLPSLRRECGGDKRS